MFAAEEGAVAAPTAGLHFTPALEAALRERGVGLQRLTLHVGAGTFLPVKVDDTDRATGCIRNGAACPRRTAAALNAARAKGGRIVAVGTTSLRLLESAAREDGTIAPFEGETAIFITPGYRFRAVDVLHDQLPSAALDAVHAGVGLLRARHHEARLRACDRGRLSLLFVWRCVRCFVGWVSVRKAPTAAIMPAHAGQERRRFRTNASDHWVTHSR